MNIDLSSEEKVNLLVSVSRRMGVSSDDLLAVYILIGDAIFFLFDLFQGRTVKFPTMRSFHHALSHNRLVEFIKLRKSHYLINGVDSYKEDIVSGDTVYIDGVDVVAKSSPMNYLGETYLLIEKKKENL